MKSIGNVFNFLNVGVAYVVLPSNSNFTRAEFIDNCYKSHTLLLFDPIQQAVFHNCFCDKEKIQQINFPQTIDQYGTFVLYAKIPGINVPVVIATLRDKNDNLDLQEHSFRKFQKYETMIIDIFAKVKEGVLDVILQSDVEDEIEMNVVVRNSDKTAKLNISVAGEVNFRELEVLHVFVNQYCNIVFVDDEDKQVGELKLSQDELTYSVNNTKFIINTKTGDFLFSNKNKQVISLTQKECRLSLQKAKLITTTSSEDSSQLEPYILGNQLVSLLDDLLSALTNTQIYVSPTGPLPLSNVLEFQVIKSKIKNILSQRAFLDK